MNIDWLDSTSCHDVARVGAIVRLAENLPVLHRRGLRRHRRRVGGTGLGCVASGSWTVHDVRGAARLAADRVILAGVVARRVREGLGHRHPAVFGQPVVIIENPGGGLHRVPGFEFFLGQQVVPERNVS